jgi:hypothetical protein
MEREEERNERVIKTKEKGITRYKKETRERDGHTERRETELPLCYVTLTLSLTG